MWRRDTWLAWILEKELIRLQTQDWGVTALQKQLRKNYIWDVLYPFRKYYNEIWDISHLRFRQHKLWIFIVLHRQSVLNLVEAGSFLISGFISYRGNHLEKFLAALWSRYNPGEASKRWRRAVIMNYYFKSVHFCTASGLFQGNKVVFTSDNSVFPSARLWKTFPRLIRLSKENPRLGNTYSLWSFLKTFLNRWATVTGLWSAA